jgi:N-acetylglucosamine kinase-like BadF-type ATPase
MRSVLGFDGGGTKTECVLMDEARNVLALRRSGPSNLVRVGFELAIAAIKEAAESAMSEAHVEPGAIAALCAGIAGTGDVGAAKRIRGGLAAVFPGVAVKICTDLEIALAAAGEGPAIVLIAGTGSAAVGRGVTGHMQRVGGLGPRIGDEGSAGDIGKKAVMAAKLHRDRTGEEARLGKKLLSHLGVANWMELQDRVRSTGLRSTGFGSPSEQDYQDTFPRLFPVVANAADAGEEMARELLRSAVGHLAALVKALVDALSLREVPFRLAKMGGMIGRCAFFDGELDLRLREVAPKARIGLLPILPAHAAAVLALDLIRGGGLAVDFNGVTPRK